MLSRDETIGTVRRAASAAELFGPGTADPERQRDAHRLYRRLAAALHPDRVGAADTQARDTLLALSRRYREWQRGADSAVVLRTPSGGTYRIGAPLGVGAVANTYRATDVDGTARVVKMVRNPPMNALLYAEWDALRSLRELTHAHRWLAPYYPRLVDTSGLVARGERAASVFEPLLDGFVTMADIRRAFPGGLDGRDYAWMHRRLLRAVAGAHRAGLVHGAIVAEHVLVHPAEHGVVLADWSFSVEQGQRLLATSTAPNLRRAYPPEVLRGSSVTAATDVHMAHQLMLDMLAHEETRQRAFARGCTQARPERRPDAADLLDEYDELLDELYGARRFRPFALPAHRNGA
jgi:hypothetical protein